MPPFPVGISGGPGAALPGGDLEERASRQASGQDITTASILSLVLQSPQLGEPGASALESLDSRGGFLIDRSKNAPTGRAHGGQAEPSTQLRLGGFSPSSQQVGLEGIRILGLPTNAPSGCAK